MKWSRYNHLFKGENKFFLYNALSNSFAELDEDFYHQLSNAPAEPCSIDIDGDLREQLLTMKVWVKDDRDEVNRIKYLTQKRRFFDKHLELTINPTLQCNFACPYCFEESHPNIYMSDEVEEGIIRFIQAHNTVKSLHITWFGGEPLLAFERIVSLTQKIQALNLNYRAGMITNGYLFTENIASQLTDLNIRKVQITIDGNERTHDSRRCLRSGKGTFKKIVDNVEMLQRIAPEVRVNLRVNIDATNQDDFIELHRFFTDKHYPNLVVSPAFVTDLSGCNVDDCIFDTERKLQFIFKMKHEHGLNCIPFYPLSHRYECTVRNANTVVIGPEGELYKCWNDVGNKDAVVGYVDGKITNETLLLRYLTGADPFEDPKCRECLLLPVCGGGCPYSRLKKEYEQKEVELCSLMKDHLDEFLLYHYHHVMEQKDYKTKTI